MEVTSIHKNSLSRRAIGIIFYLGFACLLLTSIAILKFGSVANSFSYLRGERIRVDEATRMLGQVHVGDTKVITYTLTNLTGRTVRVLGSSASCGCTEVREVPKSLLMSEAHLVELVFRPLDDQAGTKAEGTLTLFLDDPVVDQLSLRFSAFVTSDRSDPPSKRSDSG